MKQKLFLSPVCVLLLALMMGACSKSEPINEPGGMGLEIDTAYADTIEFNFSRFVQTDFASTRSELSSSGMTDLWVFDFIGDELQQVVYQSSVDTSFGSVRVPATFGNHVFCFVAAKGTSPTVSGSVITWDKPNDTFWARHELSVVPNMAAQEETLNRVATRVRISVTSEITDDMKILSVSPSTWYYALDAKDGTATGVQQRERIVQIPSNYVGSGLPLTMSVFGISPAGEWTTDMVVVTRDGDGAVLNSVVLTDVPLRRNRTTTYSGSLSTAGALSNIMLNDDWADELEINW